MTYRIITHGACTDGYSSAFIVKKYFNLFFNTSLSEEEIVQIHVIGLMPKEVQLGEFEFQENDIVLDLPQPLTNVLFWCDHHATNKPLEDKPEFHWKITPSCAGYLLDLAIEQGAVLNKEQIEFKQAMDIIDNAEYTPDTINECYYRQDSYDNPSILQKMHMIGAMFNTRDRNLNSEVFTTILTSPLGDTPLSSPELWKLNPMMYYKAQLTGFEIWRECVDEYIEYNEQAKCVVQDDRKTLKRKGVPDRFYSCMKFPQASYTLNVRVMDDGKARVGIGSNIFHKDRCKVDIGKLCFNVGKKFGSGSGGGHFHVGGCTIKEENIDAALAYIYESFTQG